MNDAWKAMGGAQKGYITMQDFYENFDRSMPKCFDRDLALELFRELDGDNDGNLSYKDFYDSLKF